MILALKITNILVSLFVLFNLSFLPMNVLAQSTYSCGAYGVNTYSENNCDEAGSSKQSLWGKLSKTGMDALPYLLAALLLMFGSTVLFRLARNSSSNTK